MNADALTAAMARNRAALALKDGLDRGIDHDELRRLAQRYLQADRALWLWGPLWMQAAP